MRKNHVVKSVVCLLLVFAFALFVPAAVSRPAGAEEIKWFESTPSSACFDKLWVGDTVQFIRGYNHETEIVSGDNVQVNGDTCHFTKPGKAQVKVKETQSGESREQTFSFTVTERPKDKPLEVVVQVHKSPNLKMKIGERFQDTAGGKEMLGYKGDFMTLTLENCNYGGRYSSGLFENCILISRWGWGRNTGCSFWFNAVDDSRSAVGSFNDDAYGFAGLPTAVAYAPYESSVNVYQKSSVNVYQSDDKLIKSVPFGKITIEEPVIKTNAPATVKVGSTLNFTTSLTNTALKNLKTAQYEDERNYSISDHFVYNLPDDVLEKDWMDVFGIDIYNPKTSKADLEKVNPVAYKPSVTVIEGKDCVTQSKQDYGNTLSSSETLTFKKPGTVKLKITYNQFDTAFMLTKQVYDEESKQPIENPYEKMEDIRYNPTATVTIQVTADGKPASGGQAGSQSGKPAGGASSKAQALPQIDSKDLVLENSETGITVGADEGVIPSGSVLTAKPSDYVLKDPAGKFAAFDLTLENGGVAVQPNGKVQVAIPIPDGFDKNRLTVYRVEESDDLTELPCAVAGDTVTFETDHFSVYVVAETGKQTAAAVAKAGKRSPLPWILGGAGVLLAAGCAFLLLWRFKFRKKKPAGETGEE